MGLLLIIISYEDTAFQLSEEMHRGSFINKNGPFAKYF